MEQGDSRNNELIGDLKSQSQANNTRDSTVPIPASVAPPPSSSKKRASSPRIDYIDLLMGSSSSYTRKEETVYHPTSPQIDYIGQMDSSPSNSKAKKTMCDVTVVNSTISGLHITKKSSHPDIKLLVVPDSARASYDKNCLKVMCPELEQIPPELHGEIVWPRNLKSRRPDDLLVKDVAGAKVGSVPANLCGLFKGLLDDGRVKSIECVSVASKPRASMLGQRAFLKSASGKDRRGGGVVLDCKYIIHTEVTRRREVINEIVQFLNGHDGDERVV